MENKTINAYNGDSSYTKDPLTGESLIILEKDERFSELESLLSDKFEEILSKYPDIKEKVRMIKNERKNIEE